MASAQETAVPVATEEKVASPVKKVPSDAAPEEVKSSESNGTTHVANGDVEKNGVAKETNGHSEKAEETKEDEKATEDEGSVKRKSEAVTDEDVSAVKKQKGEGDEEPQKEEEKSSEEQPNEGGDAAEAKA